jgi:hypothetical protein
MDQTVTNGSVRYKWTGPLQMDQSVTNGPVSYKWTSPLQMELDGVSMNMTTNNEMLVFIGEFHFLIMNFISEINKLLNLWYFSRQDLVQNLF